MGGTWPLMIHSNGGVNIPDATKQTRATAPVINLLKECAPTIMERWDLSNISIPVAITAQMFNEEGAEKEEEMVGEFTVEAILRMGGDIVWTGSVTRPYTLPKVPKVLATIAANSIIAGDLQNPISLTRGKTLTLEIVGEVQAPANVNLFSLELEVNPASSVTNGTDITPAEGTIIYESVTLDGHRTL
jgi:hypothetical protein